MARKKREFYRNVEPITKFTKKSMSTIENWIVDDLKCRKAKGMLTWKEVKPEDRKKGVKYDSIYKWGLYLEKKEYRIKRFIKRKDGKTTWQRLEKKFYKHFLNNKKELDNIILILNDIDPDEHFAKIRYKYKTGYIPKSKVLKFCDRVRVEFANDDKKDINCRIRAFIKYGLDWFQEVSPKPTVWKQNEKRWGRCLLNFYNDIEDNERIFPLNELRSRNTIKRVIWLMNDFLAFLHEEYPYRHPPLELNPISKSQFKTLEEKRKKRKRTHIPEKDWKVIQENIKDDPYLRIIELCYELGLRRNEALGLATNHSFYGDNLLIDRQLKGINRTNGEKTYKKPKNKESRRIPYKTSINNLTGHQMAKIVATTQTISGDQLTKKWRKLMIKLKFSYDIHDARHSAIRNFFIIKGYDIKTAMEYSGHKELQSINSYVRSKGQLSEQKINPFHLVPKDDQTDPNDDHTDQAV